MTDETPAAVQPVHSANAGLIIHRTGQIKNEFHAEGLQFGFDLVAGITMTQAGVMGIELYEEQFGVYNRLHWILHLRHPNDYRRLLDMVDHDKMWRELTDLDRLPAKGGGGWERLFVESSISETVICPQHGLGHGVGEHQEETFQPAAMYQTDLPVDAQLHSANSSYTVHRVGQAKYAVREEARLFNYEWAQRVNEALKGAATAFVYEEMWGRQDRIHTLIHLASLEAYHEIQALAVHDAGMRELLASRRVPAFKGGGTWEHLFVDGSISETVLAPRHRESR
jgi:hypothetical protein